jgi:prepilin-type N-terminal cleavage/methylation domain-containing protein
LFVKNFFCFCNQRQNQVNETNCDIVGLQSGFTLLELLVVSLILAALAGAVVASYNGIDAQANYDIAKNDMAEIRKALLQFRRDSGTESFPGQGQYDCTDAFNGGDATDQNSMMSFPAEAGANDAEIIAWCQHPANFWMLFQDPLASGWNMDTKRGWNGPYLQRQNGYVDVSEQISINGSGDVASGAVITNLWGVASPYEIEPFGANNYFAWRTAVGGQNFARYGTPYFLFDLATPDDANNPPRIVSLNADNDYNGDSTCEQTLGNDDFPLDSILCLLQ